MIPMTVFSRYNYAYVKNKKSRLPLLVLCVFVVVMMFTIIKAVPIVINSFAKDTTKSLYGNSDLYIMGSNDNREPITTYARMPQEIRDNSEYISYSFAVPGLNNYNERISSALIMGVNYNELEGYNPIDFYEGNPSELKLNEIIISRALADEQHISVGLDTNIVYLGKAYKMKVVGIAENEGMFKIKSQNLFLVSKQTMQNIVAIPVDVMFNICMIKLSPDSEVSVDRAYELLKAAYSNWNVGISDEDPEVTGILNLSMSPIIVCGIIVLIYALFACYMIVKRTMTTTLKQFSVQVFISESKTRDYFDVLIQSLYYGGASALLSGLLVNSVFEAALGSSRGHVIRSVGLDYFASVILFGAIFAVFTSLVSAIAVKKSGYEQNEKSKEMDSKAFFYYLSSVLIILVASTIVASLQPKGRIEWLSIVVFALVVLATLILLPHIIRVLILLINKFIKNKSVDRDYRTHTSFLYNSLIGSSRIIFITIFLVGFIFSTTQTIQTSVMAESKIDYYSISIDNINDGKGYFITQKLYGLPIVKRVYEVTTVQNTTLHFEGSEQELKIVRGMKPTDVDKIYGKIILTDKTSVIKKLSSTNNNILLSSSYHYLHNLNTGDKVHLSLPIDGGEELVEFVIAGFVDTVEGSNKYAILNIDVLNKFTDTNRSNGVLIDVDELDADELNAYIKSEFGSDYVVNSAYESNRLNLELSELPARVFAYLNNFIMVLAVLFIPLGIYWDVRRLSSQIRFAKTSGNNKKKLIATYILQQFFVIIASIVAAIGLLFILSTAIENMYIMSGSYLPLVIAWRDIILCTGLIIIISAIGTTAILLTKLEDYAYKDPAKKVRGASPQYKNKK